MTDPIRKTMLTTPPNSLGPTALPREPSKTKEVAKQFEAVFLTDTVQQMMKNSGTGAIGSSNAEDTWRSFLSEAIAKKIADSGTTGIAQSIERMLGAYGDRKA